MSGASSDMLGPVKVGMEIVRNIDFRVSPKSVIIAIGLPWFEWVCSLNTGQSHL
jgi:hypothetical protein